MSIPGGEGVSITSENGSALNGRPSFLTLDPEKIVGTVVSLSNRIEERFPNSGLGRVCRRLLAIAHRLSTLRHVDRIVVLDGGRLVEEGTHETLLARSGLYRTLYEAQFQV